VDQQQKKQREACEQQRQADGQQALRKCRETMEFCLEKRFVVKANQYLPT
jgi:hypothetical protein